MSATYAAEAGKKNISPNVQTATVAANGPDVEANAIAPKPAPGQERAEGERSPVRPVRRGGVQGHLESTISSVLTEKSRPKVDSGRRWSRTIQSGMAERCWKKTRVDRRRAARKKRKRPSRWARGQANRASPGGCAPRYLAREGRGERARRPPRSRLPRRRRTGSGTTRRQGSLPTAGPDAHAEVDREPVERERRLALRRAGRGRR